MNRASDGGGGASAAAGDDGDGDDGDDGDSDDGGGADESMVWGRDMGYELGTCSPPSFCTRSGQSRGVAKCPGGQFAKLSDQTSWWT